MFNIATNGREIKPEEIFGKAAGRKVQTLCNEIYHSKLYENVENDKALRKLYSIAKSCNIRIEWYGRAIPCCPDQFEIVRKGVSIGRIYC